MTAVALRKRGPGRPRLGSPKPRLAPPTPMHGNLAALRKEFECLGIDPMPWQETVGRFLYGTTVDSRWLFPEVATIVARQNGKTEILVPHVTTRMLMGRRIMHTAQNRELPREVYGRVADHMVAKHAALLAKMPRFANGQEEMRLLNGGKYRIVAPTRGGARGPSNDDVIVDEARELDDHDFIAAARPTLMASPNPQMLYLSNMGDDSSVVLNALKERSGKDPGLAYLEWSADPELASGDREGWYQANPASGHLPRLMENLEKDFTSHSLAGTLYIFETENLCRRVASMRERLVDAFSWTRCDGGELEAPRRPMMAVSVDPAGRRASAAIAWQRPDDTIGLRLVFDVTGSPIDLDRLGADMRQWAIRAGVPMVGFDRITDAGLAKHFPKSKAIVGPEFVAASSQFVNAVTGTRIRWQDVAAVTDDLTWTARKPNAERGTFEAVRAQDDRPVTAALAAIRAVWLASGPRPTAPKVT